MIDLSGSGEFYALGGAQPDPGNRAVSPGITGVIDTIQCSEALNLGIGEPI
jgi:hypothetical protein